MHLLQKLALLALAGAAGTVSRYALGAAIDRVTGNEFPWSIFAINMLGCFLFGLVFALTESRVAWSGDARVIVLGGFMGAFTTYSTFAFQSTELLRGAQWGFAAANILGQNVLGIVCVLLGIALGKIV